MDFNYSNEQTALQEMLQRFVNREYDFGRRRELARSALGYSADAWARFAELGILALSIPEEFGGFGGNAVDVMLVMESMGRGLLLEPFLSTVVLCGGLIRDSGSPAVKRSLLPRIGTGEIKLALACYEASGRYDLSQVTCTATPEGGGWRLSGQKTVVLDAPSADYFLVSARGGEGAGGTSDVRDARGISVFLVGREAEGVTLLAYPTQSGGRAAD
ncbi:MAG: acyl-CoA dehydrogenase family protein, partial [Steroidobacteraceae bacterium]